MPNVREFFTKVIRQCMASSLAAGLEPLVLMAVYRDGDGTGTVTLTADCVVASAVEKKLSGAVDEFLGPPAVDVLEKIQIIVQRDAERN